MSSQEEKKMGVILIKPLKGKMMSGEDYSKCQFYLAFRVGKTTKKTVESKYFGSTPSWNDELTLHFNTEKFVTFEMWDEVKNDLIGLGEILIEEILKEKKIAKWFSLVSNNRTVGEIYIEAKFYTDSSAKEGILQLENPSTLIEQDEQIFNELQNLVYETTFSANSDFLLNKISEEILYNGLYMLAEKKPAHPIRELGLFLLKSVDEKAV